MYLYLVYESNKRPNIIKSTLYTVIRIKPRTHSLHIKKKSIKIPQEKIVTKKVVKPILHGVTLIEKEIYSRFHTIQNF